MHLYAQASQPLLAVKVNLKKQQKVELMSVLDHLATLKT
jgi:hypothetical protein